MELDRNGLHILSPAECMDLLATEHIGRIALSHHALPTIKPVLYEVDGSAITFHASGGLLADAAVRGDVVCFEADFADASAGQLWSVVVIGRLELVPSESSSGDEAAVMRFGSERVALPIALVTGRSTTAQSVTA